MTLRILLSPITLLALFAPALAAAQSSGDTGGTVELILYGLIGFFGALSVFTFGWGFVVYIIRLGTERRDAGIHIMEWGVSILVVVAILIGILRWVH